MVETLHFLVLFVIMSDRRLEHLLMVMCIALIWL
jgi:hypothetical protein